MSMKYITAYLIAALSGSPAPSKNDITKIVTSVGGEVDEEVLDGFLAAVQDKQPHELISSGLSKLQNLSLSAAPAAPSSSAPAAKAAEEPEASPAAKEEEEEDDDMGFSLFD